jgi:hypothetical protein
VTISGYEDVPANDEQALVKALAHQPVSVAIEASGRHFQFYSGVSISPGLVLQHFFPKTSHRIFIHIHRTLNID